MATQLSIFDILTPPPPPAAVAAPRLARPLGDFDRDLAEAKAATARATAAGRIETLAWGEGVKGSRFGKPGYLLQFFEDGGDWYARDELSLHNSGSSGPFWLAGNAFSGRLQTREDVILFYMRQILRGAATTMARPTGDDETRAKQYAKLAAWAIAQCPALIYGADLKAEFAALRDRADAQEARRSAAFSAAHELARRATDVLRSINAYAYHGGATQGLIQNHGEKDWPGKGEDPAGHARAWPAEWAISGHAPDALSLTIYPRTGQTDSKAVRAALDALRIALPEPIVMADEDAPYPRDNWTWEDKL